MKLGQKHLIECHCILPQYRKSKNTVFHKFVVFSILENDVVIPKYVQCNNCNAVHKVYDLCKSEIIPGRDELRSVTTLQEIKLTVPDQLSSLLETYDCDLPTWEAASFIYNHEKWGDTVILTKDSIEDETQGKRLTINSGPRFILENYINREVINVEQ